jgi:hypothetical protein
MAWIEEWESMVPVGFPGEQRKIALIEGVERTVDLI